MTKRYEELLEFVLRNMRMSHVYQPVMLRTLLDSKGRASREEIARRLLNEDEAQLEYYCEIVRDMVGKVLTRRGIVRREGRDYILEGFGGLTPSQIESLRQACDARLTEYLDRRTTSPWQHRRRSAGYISGSLKYEVLKRARFRCELCGISAEECALEVDHIRPRNKGGDDDISNLQALCFRCNAMKRDRDDTDFRAVRESLDLTDPECTFCNIRGRTVVSQNKLSIAIADAFPVTKGHTLVLPRRHEPDYFRLGAAEVRACVALLAACREKLLEQDSSIAGFNVGINSGKAAGQTVMHCHIHLIPRREGDIPDPRGGVRAVIPGKAKYD